MVKTSMMTDYIQDTYAEELEAFDIWLKDAGYTGYTVKSYKSDVSEFLDTLEGKPIDRVKRLQVLSFLSRHVTVVLVMRLGIGSMQP